MDSASGRPVPDGHEPASPAPQVLELRVHGVNNTTPHDMLDLPAEAIRMVTGDTLGSFWQRKDDVPNPKPTERGHTPDGVVREAYSWGNLARTTFGGPSGAIGTLVQGVSRVLWTMLLPFALTNVAYWSRRLHYGPPGRALFRPLTERKAGGAWIFRFGGLLLSLLTAATATVLSVDVVGVQCRPVPAVPAACTNIPDIVGFLAGWSLGQRMAFLSLIPVALLAALWALSSYTRTRFEQATRNQRPRSVDSINRRAELPTSATASPRWPLLSTPGFWNHSPISGPSAHVHLAVPVALVIAVSSWHLATHTSGLAVVLNTALFVASLAVLLWGTWVLLRLAPLAADIDLTPEEEASNPTRLREKESLRDSRRLVVTAALTFIAFLIVALALGTATDDDVSAMTGTGVAIDLLLALLVALVVTALSVRRAALDEQRRFRGSIELALPGVVLGVLAVDLLGGWRWLSWWPAERPWWVGVLLAAAVLVIGLVAARLSRGPGIPAFDGSPLTEAQATGWGGRAPGVFLGLAAYFCLVIASTLTLGIADRFNGDHSAGSLLGLGVPNGSQAGPARDLVVPAPLGWFALAAGLGVLLLGAVVGVCALRWGPLPARLTTLAWPAGTLSVNGVGDPSGPNGPGGPGDPGEQDGPMARAVFAKRRFAAGAHRAEPLLAGILLTCGAAIALIGVARAFEPVRDVGPNIVTAGHAILALAATATLGLASGTSAGGRPTRPLGILWDLAGVVPRSAHPLGPPCYGERVVPELLARCRWWLTQEGAGTPDEALSGSPRAVVMSAHSLGGVLAVAAVLGAPWPTEAGWHPPDPRQDHQATPNRWMVPRFGLVTYGTQLRAYFSRYFPELLGPAVLGVAPARAASLTAPDPWEGQWAPQVGADPPPRPLPGSVRHLLGAAPPDDAAAGATLPAPRWVSLWRLTDYLGMPLVAMPPGEGFVGPTSPAYAWRDWYATEVDYTAYLLTVMTHGEYPRTAEYGDAVALLRDELTPPGAGNGNP